MIQEWWGNVVDKEDLTRHDKWLCMMMPRLKLLRELLSEDGGIFVSIDDNEDHRLRTLLDEIFGLDNFVQTIVWQKNSGGGNDANYIASSHEYILVYAKNKLGSNFRIYNLPPSEEMLKSFNLEDEFVKTRGQYTLRNLNDFSIGDRPGLHYDIECPDGALLLGKEYRWRCDEKKFEKRIKENRIVFQKNDDDEWQVFYKQYINEQKEEIEIDEDGTILSLGKKPSSLLIKLAFTGEGKKDLKEIFGITPFNYPKPVELIKALLIISCKKNDIILDAFGGSGTTAQAVIELNNKDKGSRKFIIIQEDELIKQKVYINKKTDAEVERPKKGETKSEIRVKPFAIEGGIILEKVADIILNRIKKVIEGVTTARRKETQIKSKTTFSYFELGDTIEMESLLRGNNLPTYTEFARYLFYTATGDEFNEKAINEKTGFIGESKNYEVYLFYKAELDWLKKNALTLELCKSLPKFKNKKRLVFAPAKYVDDHTLLDYQIDFCQLPYEIYRIQR
jgi:adenine-specific DNA-methyltransferase